MAIRVLPTTPATSLERLVDDYLTNCQARGLAPKSLKQYSFSLRSVFLPWCAGESIEDLVQLDRRAFDRFTSSLLARRNDAGMPLSKFSVHTYIRPVRLLLTWAQKQGEEVTAKPELPRRPTLAKDVLSRDEIDLLERSVLSERDKVVIRIFGDCGLRLFELTELEASSVIRSGRQAHLRVPGKWGKTRDVPVPPQLLRRLDRLIEGRPRERSSERIFLAARRSSRGQYEPLTEGGVYQIVKDAMARSGIEKRGYPHLLRHSWMTEMIRNGMHPIQLSVIAGASMEVITQHYAHLTKDDAYDAMIRVLTARRV
jgi:site-specific recombinase XerD